VRPTRHIFASVTSGSCRRGVGTALITRHGSPAIECVGTFVAELAGLLGELFVDPRGIAAVANFSDGGYVQLWAQDGASLVSGMNAIISPQEARVACSGDE